MSRTALARPAAQPVAPLTSLLARLRRHLAALDAAHDRQARFASLKDEDSRDLGLPHEAILGEPAQDQALPFFLQRRPRD